jgi:hypothetical protein
MYGGDNFTSFGAAKEATKKYKNKTDHGLRRPPDDEFDITANQKQACTMEGTYYRTCDQ